MEHRVSDCEPGVLPKTSGRKKCVPGETFRIALHVSLQLVGETRMPAVIALSPSIVQINQVMQKGAVDLSCRVERGELASTRQCLVELAPVHRIAKYVDAVAGRLRLLIQGPRSFLGFGQDVLAGFGQG